MDSVGEGEGGEIWENGIETCIISCMKREKKRKENENTFLTKKKKRWHRNKQTNKQTNQPNNIVVKSSDFLRDQNLMIPTTKKNG